MATVSPDREVVMGRVDTTLTITNSADQARAEAGDIGAAEVRSVTLDGALVDTGATFLSLPADVVARLGLRPIREVTIRTAAGPRQARVFRDTGLALGRHPYGGARHRAGFDEPAAPPPARWVAGQLRHRPVAMAVVLLATPGYAGYGTYAF